MKKKIYLLSLSLLVLSQLFTSSAIAAGHGKGGETPAPTALPINNAVIVLLILGFAMGILAIHKYKIATIKA